MESDIPVLAESLLEMQEAAGLAGQSASSSPPPGGAPSVLLVCINGSSGVRARESLCKAEHSKCERRELPRYDGHREGALPGAVAVALRAQPAPLEVAASGSRHAL